MCPTPKTAPWVQHIGANDQGRVHPPLASRPAMPCLGQTPLPASSRSCAHPPPNHDERRGRSCGSVASATPRWRRWHPPPPGRNRANVWVGLKGPPPGKQGGRMQLSPRGSQPWCHQTGVPKAQPPVLQRRCARRGGCMMVGHGATNILRYLRGPRAVSSVGSEHLVYTEGVGGSSPSPPTQIPPQRPLHCRGFFDAPNMRQAV